jgi:hypothetical protein
VGPAPAEIDGVIVVLYTPIDHRHRATGNCRHVVAGEPPAPAAALAVCQYRNEAGYYLFGCNEDWSCVTDTWHPTIQEAKGQAEFEYEGVSATWQPRA